MFMRTGMVFALALLLQGCAAELVVSEYDFRPCRKFSGWSATSTAARGSSTISAMWIGLKPIRGAAPAQHIDLDINGTVGVPGSSVHLLAFNGEGITWVPSLAGVQGSHHHPRSVDRPAAGHRPGGADHHLDDRHG
jgi:hypothetical protein